MDTEPTVGIRIIRRALGLAFLAFFLIASVVAGSFAGWGLGERTTVERIQDAVPSLLMSLTWGAVAIAGFRLLLGHRLLSRWLACALVIPASAALHAADVL
ncbi:hypothetical protein AMK26_24640 [Streptomyces sp. CB03234]|uniref:hypothetical protein n=1 Tax=Streptomyces sp. (strain CB03234) TaxID=1703937 RepID=UPI00093A7CB9|nr:hypothetical protein [Streptomyces sp. CB03234]OKK02768.1 hypothetical protein AMK26_24640 [Streptomyces sp. CB03234]